jgi:small subunit ribosomal protein S5
MLENNVNKELIEKLISVRRVSKVVKGGRRFGFAALVVSGDGQGRVGFGSGKAKEVPEAIRKASEEAKKTMVRTIHHDIKAKFSSSTVILRSAPKGTGIISGGPSRAIFEALGISDVVSKAIGTKNPHNIVRSTIKALRMINTPKSVSARRGIEINSVISKREN